MPTRTDAMLQTSPRTSPPTPIRQTPPHSRYTSPAPSNAPSMASQAIQSNLDAMSQNSHYIGTPRGEDRATYFPWWPTTFADAADLQGKEVGADADMQQSFHTETRLADGRIGLLVDPGSVGNLAGDEWMQGLAKEAFDSGRKPSETRRPRPLQVSGVGAGAQECTHNCVIPTACVGADGKADEGTFTAPTVKGSQLPGLLGLHSLEQCRAILDMHKGKLHFCGPGDYDLEQHLPPGTKTYDLAKAPSGHLLLPCNLYNKADQQEKTKKVQLDKKIISLHAKEDPGTDAAGQPASASEPVQSNL